MLTPNAEFRPRYLHSCFELDEHIYITGGVARIGFRLTGLRDMWKSKDGKIWVLVSEDIIPKSIIDTHLSLNQANEYNGIINSVVV